MKSTIFLFCFLSQNKNAYEQLREREKKKKEKTVSHPCIARSRYCPFRYLLNFVTCIGYWIVQSEVGY